MKKILFLLSVVVLGTSCIDDTGNYDYNDINVVTIDVPATTDVQLVAQTFRLQPEIIQSKATDMKNLSFEWRHSINSFVLANMSEVVSTEPYVDIEIDPATITNYIHYYRLFVIDDLTGVRYPVDARVRILKPYDGAWMVLHDQGGAKVGGVEFYGEGVSKVTVDAFAAAGAPALTGNPVGLGVMYQTGINWPDTYLAPTPGTYYSLFWVVTDDPSSSANYCQWRGFEKTRTVADMPENKGLITSEALADMLMLEDFSEHTSAVFGGQLYCGMGGFKLYPAKTNVGETDIKVASRVGWHTLLYDTKDPDNRRILFFPNSDNSRGTGSRPNYYYTPTYYHSNEHKAIIKDMNNPNNQAVINPIPADREIVYFGSGATGDGTGATYRRSKSFAVGLGNNKRTYVYQFVESYKFATSSNANLEKIYEVATPEGLTAESQFASSYVYNGIFFFSSGSKIYRFDYLTGSGRVTEIYNHGSGTIKKMEFARREAPTTSSTPVLFETYGVNVNRSLGVLVETGANSSELVVINLAESGILSTDSSVRPVVEVFSGFGRGVDIVFL